MANKKFPKKTACELAHKLCTSNLFSNLYTYFNTVKKKKKGKAFTHRRFNFYIFFSHEFWNIFCSSENI